MSPRTNISQYFPIIGTNHPHLITLLANPSKKGNEHLYLHSKLLKNTNNQKDLWLIANVPPKDGSWRHEPRRRRFYKSVYNVIAAVLFMGGIIYFAKNFRE